MFHRHQWKEIARTYAQSLREMGCIKVKCATEDAIMGKTTILWECSICQKTRKEEMSGKIIS